MKFLVVYWNEVRHEAPHCTRWLLLDFIFSQSAPRGAWIWRRSRVATASDWWIFIAVVSPKRYKCKQGGPGQEGCLKLDCRSTDGRRTVLTRSRFLFFPSPAWTAFVSRRGYRADAEKSTYLAHCTWEPFAWEHSLALSLHSADYVQSPYGWIDFITHKEETETDNRRVGCAVHAVLTATETGN